MDNLPRTSNDAIVTPDNFNRAETDMYFRWTVRLAGGIGWAVYGALALFAHFGPVMACTVPKPRRQAHDLRVRPSAGPTMIRPWPHCST